MRAPVVLRGFEDGIVIHLDDRRDFVMVEAALRARLATAGRLLGNVAVTVNVGERELTPAQLGRLREALAEFNLTPARVVREVRLDGEAGLAAKAMPVFPGTESATGSDGQWASRSEDTLLYRGTLRSGQKVQYQGNVVILGDVHAGAEVVAGGDVVVMGTLRGMAHAGAPANELAVVVAYRLLPAQLRIADVLGRAPDHPEKPDRPELARLQDRQIIVEPYIFRQGG